MNKMPIENGFYMPAEWEHHKGCWMEWPTRTELWGKKIERAYQAYGRVAKAIAELEPITMICNTGKEGEVRHYCGSKISIINFPHDDSWMRDNGPTFLINAKGETAGVAWGWNAWGNKYASHHQDAKIAEGVLNHLSLPCFKAPLITEGGAIHVDGQGTLITTESCLLNPNRNPGLTKKDIEEIFYNFLGIKKVIWLPGGVEDDDTDGHIDEVAAFVKTGIVLALSTQDKNDGNYKILQENIACLKKEKDALNRSLEIIEIEQPNPRYLDDGRRMSLSYINFYLPNKGVIIPFFKDSKDQEAFDLFKKIFPDRKLVQLDALDIVEGGGGIHCITQQQPKG
ncbi:MAG: agmatine deiminase family protein [Alphaproteobacteria bacterium]|nr:agmatine deiminase family protein [Alphaproteobacteria bacterium]